ncbi:GNAT family N-acetyltransferase [Nonomuraea sp. NPDC050783]|uniref:GNAT family N-acetyltransferase n=1 Tax=Nonomuraea sp. NPDC050783 TaxID=3154634 RepID=UPI0034673DAE
MTLMPIRTARPDDLPALLDLAVAFYEEEGFATPPDALRANLATLIAEPAARVALAEQEEEGEEGEEGTAAGFAITTTTFGLETALSAELQDLYVAPAARRHGLAGELIADSRRWAAAQGCTLLEIVIAPNGGDPRHLLGYYRRRGFTDEGRRLMSMPLP